MIIDFQKENRPDAAFFDLDGTLADSMGLWKKIDIDFMADRRIPMPANLQMQIAGMSMYETAVYFRKTFHLSDTPEELMAVWNRMAGDAYKNEINLKPGAISFLKKLQKAGMPMGLATSNSRELVEGFFERSGLDRFMDSVVTADEVKNGKPAPDVYLVSAEKLHVRPERCVVFEDVLQGIQAARNAGMRVYAIDDPWSREYLGEKKKLSDGVLSDFTEAEVLL